MLVDLGVANHPDRTNPTSVQWPVHTGKEPPQPVRCITVADTLGRDNGRDMTSGERQEHHGIQITVRCDEYPVGWQRANLIKQQLDTEVVYRTVIVGGVTYRVFCVAELKGIIWSKVPKEEHLLFKMNGLVSVRTV